MPPALASLETPAELLSDRLNFDGAVLGALGYGMHVIVALQCILCLLRDWPKRTARTAAHLAFIASLFVAGTLSFAGHTCSFERMFVDERDYPGGTAHFLSTHFSEPITLMANAAFVYANFLCDGVMLYRVWGAWNKNYPVMILPVLLYVASTAMSMLTMYGLSHPRASLFLQSTNVLTISLTYFTLAISLNVLLTLLIAGRLLYVSARLRGRDARPYAAIARMIVECALPYSLVGLAFIVGYALNFAANVLMPLLCQLMCMCPELIITRVSSPQRRADPEVGSASVGSTTGQKSNELDTLRESAATIISSNNMYDE